MHHFATVVAVTLLAAGLANGGPRYERKAPESGNLVTYLNQEMLDSHSIPESRLRSFEKAIGVSSLPEQYRAFLLMTNGGKTLNASSDSPDERRAPFTRGALISSFLGFDRAVYDLEVWTTSYAHRLPRNFIPIAGDQGGNLVILAADGPFEGRVYFWDHEEEYHIGLDRAGDASEHYENIYILGESFDEFFRKLYTWIDPGGP